MPSWFRELNDSAIRKIKHNNNLYLLPPPGSCHHRDYERVLVGIDPNNHAEISGPWKKQSGWIPNFRSNQPIHTGYSLV